MSVSPDLELQGALVAMASANAAFIALLPVAQIYQDVPDKPDFPYMTLGESQPIADLAEGVNGSEIYVDFHIWSRTGGFAEVKKIAAALEAALHEQSIVLVENTCLLIERYIARFQRDPDGMTKHAIVTMRALLDSD